VFRVRPSSLAGSDTLIEHGRTAGRLAVLAERLVQKN
jgi:hypothetical protein